MTGEQLIALFGDTVELLTGNPYTGRELTEDDLDRIQDKFIEEMWKIRSKEKARESDPAR